MSSISIDIIIGAILIYGIVRGFHRGFFLEVSSLISLVAGIYIASKFYNIVAKYFQKIISWEENYLIILSFIIILILSIICINLIAKSLTKLADNISLGLLNKMAGSLFGFVKYFIVCMIFVLIFDRINSTIELIDPLTLSHSELYPYIKVVNQEIFPAFIKSIYGDGL